MNFLDKTGLSHLWSKIKEYIENKKYISSPNGSIKNIVELTYDEYKALETIDPDTEYHIKDSGAGGSIEHFVRELLIESRKEEHPVGSLEFNTSGANPATYLGFGTWELWGAGKVPIGVDSSDSSIDTADKSIGSKTKSYTPAGKNTGTAVTLNAVELTHSGGAVQSHTLTISEMPSHNHLTAHINVNAKAYGGGDQWPALLTQGVDDTTGYVNHSTSTGGGGSHSHGFTQPNKHSFTPTTKSITQPTFTGTQADINVVQPSISCYMWKRIS